MILMIISAHIHMEMYGAAEITLELIEAMYHG